ncbi:hypothetical protein D9758_009485 [Tetrapyrgos nigripes]|uniref:Uncharacterized protein n=1 Tax=Tetrapyrgos nigripes TaxID=182062 RepID=A0A8H5LFU0_9AGAR|nr:hypothetical protein D9758_009485 [Tetrapyrgos nigripes]
MTLSSNNASRKPYRCLVNSLSIQEIDDIPRNQTGNVELRIQGFGGATITQQIRYEETKLSWKKAIYDVNCLNLTKAVLDYENYEYWDFFASEGADSSDHLDPLFDVRYPSSPLIHHF